MIKQLLPPSLAQDENIQALTTALDKELEKIEAQIINVLILPRIDQIEDEELLDLLAWQFHIEGYELAQNIEEKRNLIKRAIELHRYKGTKYAIKRVLEALGLEGRVQEWFEYNGQPYHFKVEINLLDVGLSEETLNNLENLINQYKNVRSWLESITAYLTTRNKRPAVGLQTLTGEYVTIYPYSISELSQNVQVPSMAVGMHSGEITTVYPLGGNA